MNERARAIAILQQAREILSKRLVARIVEAEEEIMDDAQGHSFLGEIEAIHDQVGSRLSQVNGMLSALPPESAGPASPSTELIGGAPTMSEFSTLDTASEANHLAAPISADTSTVGTGLAIESSGMSPPAGDAISFPLFIQQINARDLEAAGRSLVELLGVPYERALRCAATFHERLTSDPNFMTTAMTLRGELEKGAINSALMLLWECFGLQGPESIGAMQALKSRLDRS